MDWQDYVVWGIVAAIGAVLLWRSAGRLHGRRRSGCAGCGETDCPVKKEKPQQNNRSKNKVRS